MVIALIVVLDKANGIGKNNKLLCHLPADLKRFKQLTSGHTVVMGRKTYESLPNGALPNRKNIILTRDLRYKAENCIIAHSIDKIMEESKNEDKVFVIGGGEIYNMFMQRADLINITKIDHTFEADTFFPEIDLNIWKLDASTNLEADDKNPYNYSFQDYSRRK